MVIVFAKPLSWMIDKAQDESFTIIILISKRIIDFKISRRLLFSILITKVFLRHYSFHLNVLSMRFFSYVTTHIIHQK